MEIVKEEKDSVSCEPVKDEEKAGNDVEMETVEEKNRDVEMKSIEAKSDKVIKQEASSINPVTILPVVQVCIASLQLALL